MSQLDDAINSLSESSVIKLLRGFNIEYSDKKLIIYTSSLAEQTIVLALAKALNPQHFQLTSKSLCLSYVIISITDQCRANLQDEYSWVINYDSRSAIEQIQSIQCLGANIKYRLPGISSEATLLIRNIKSPEHVNDLKNALQNAGIGFANYDKPGMNSFANNQLILYGEDAKRIGYKLSEANIKFDGSRFLRSGNQI